MNKNFINNKVVLITGGTGSFGQKFVEVLLKKYNPKKIIIFSRDELKQFDMANVFSDFKKKLRFFIGDVRDLPRLRLAFKDVNFVIHAAALKQVPTAEYNPFETIKTNIIGTQNVIDAVIDSGVEKLLSLSTDKAAAPINLYGATKLAADKIVVAANNFSEKTFSVVRYGNVWGSRGSIVPEILKQKKKGLILITDKRMTRFSITLDYGVEFVLRCLLKMKGGEIFVPKIPSYRLIDLVKYFAANSRIKYIGIRPGEKLHEEMITKSDSLNTLEFKDYFIILPSQFAKWSRDDFINKFEKYKPNICKEDFSYNSFDNNYLSQNEIKKLIIKS
jgi:UDP-N-acetylglucosamine 4,6-dehydratase (inverting)